MNRETPRPEYQPDQIDLALLKTTWQETQYLAELMRRNKNKDGEAKMKAKADGIAQEIAKIDPAFLNAVTLQTDFQIENEVDELNARLHSKKKLDD